MRVGVVAEGWADYHVIRAVLKAALGLDGEDVRCLRPEDVADETDRHAPSAGAFSNWEIVLQECRSGARIREFLESQVQIGTEDGRFAVVHIDTAEANHKAYAVQRPDPKAPDAPALLRHAVAARLRALLEEGGCANRPVALAIAVEETDAWLLAAIGEGPETGHGRKAKERLAGALKRQNWKLPAGDVARARELAKLLRKPKDLTAATLRNGSLAAFVTELVETAETAKAAAPPPPP